MSFQAVRRRLKRPSPSMVIAMVALFIGLSGVTYAAVSDNEKINHTAGLHWGVIDRNTIGSAVGDLRTGPYGSFGVSGPAAQPPFGTGSLGLQVSDNALSGGTPQEKISFGNEVDFTGNPVSGINKVGFRVFQTGENAGDDPSDRNMPNITFEIDPNLSSSASNFTSMVWVPDGAGVLNQWSGYLNAVTTGDWYFTGATGTNTGCNQTTFCSLSAAKAALVADNNGTPASIYTFAVAKGRDDAWVGAVDGLRLNQKLYNFEAYGVEERDISP